jgi:hypothetical protein
MRIIQVIRVVIERTRSIVRSRSVRFTYAEYAISSELGELSKATTVQPQKEVPWMAGMMTLERLPTVLLLPSPFRPESATAICHAINILVNIRGGLEGNVGKYAREGNVTA